jgi:putative heme degradation protein
MGYLNEKYEYRNNDAVVCYYTYKDCCIMQGVATWDKKLIVVREYHFERKAKKEIAEFIGWVKLWINKNEYLKQAIRYCYALDFSDELDLEMLADEFEEITDTGRFINMAKKTESKHRDKCLQMLVKSLNYALNRGSISYILACEYECGNEKKFANSSTVYWHGHPSFENFEPY